MWSTSGSGPTLKFLRYEAIKKLPSLKENSNEIVTVALSFIKTYGSAGTTSLEPLIIVFDDLLLQVIFVGPGQPSKNQIIIFA